MTGKLRYAYFYLFCCKFLTFLYNYLIIVNLNGDVPEKKRRLSFGACSMILFVDSCIAKMVRFLEAKDTVDDVFSWLVLQFIVSCVSAVLDVDILQCHGD